MAKTNSSNLPHNIMGFVNDPVSEQIILNVIKEMSIGYAEVTQGTLTEAVEFLKNNRTPKVLVFDISESELPLSDIVKIREHSTPNITVIAIGSKNDVGLYRDLMVAGVSDYLVKPLNNELMRHAIEKANGLIKGEIEKVGKMIQFISSVGGAGATTVATNIGWILASHYFKRAVIMDMDFLYGTANLMLDLKTESAYLDILESPDKIDDYFVETIIKKYDQRLYYLGGLVDLMRGAVVDNDAFDALITLVKKQFNYILVDAQRDLSSPNRICMSKSDCFVILVEMSMASAQNTTRLLEFLTTDQGGKKVILIANKVGLSSSGALSKAAFEKAVDRKIDYVMPLDEATPLASANIGQPLASSNCALTNVLNDIAEDLLGKKEHKEIAQSIVESKGWTVDRVKDIVFDKIGDVISRLK
ncbi:MAG: AAA family ATPase [Holosporaceae bacterium]|jgi:pilus assembly protein CpaE|nr:AAA family ATPase [Holosporaceae bacterium]